MNKYTIYGEEFVPKFSFPIKGKFKRKDLYLIDLSRTNQELSKLGVKSCDDLDKYVFGKIESHSAKGAYGGYLEDRALYKMSNVFANGKAHRNIHLGIDFWFPAGTAVCAPLPGRIHSFKDNDSVGDYGPTIILEHYVGNEKIYSLYGHLSKQSLIGLKKGHMVMRGEVFAYLGSPDENVNWPPHLHFQLIYDLEGKYGDYPGVCFESEVKFQKKNCPDPIDFFGGFQGVLLAKKKENV